MDYCFFAPTKGETTLDKLNLSLVWQVEASASYHVAYTPDAVADMCVAVRTVSGEGELITRHEKYSLIEGTLLVLPLHMVLEYRTKKPLWSFYWFEFTGCPKENVGLTTVPISESEYCLLGDLISSLCSQSAPWTQSGFSYIFNRWISISKDDATDIALEVARYINASPTEASLSFESLLAHFNISERTLRRRFQEAFEMSPKQYILDKRIKLAAILLKTTDMKLRDISVKAGFQNEYYFSTCFKKHYGIPPTEYRNCKTP